MTMNLAEFKQRGYEIIDYVANFMDTIRDRSPAPNVQPGYLAKLIPRVAPEQPQSWEDIMEDIEPCIMDGMVFWNHPHFHAYFASGNSWPSVLAGIFINATASNCATWETCPVGTELEIIVCDWLAKMLELPHHFLSPWSNPESKGGGIIQGSASESIFLAMIAAREYTLTKTEKVHPGVDRAILKGKLIAYANNQSHSCIEKGAIMAGVRCLLLEPNGTGCLDAYTLHDQIQRDIKDGLIPFFMNGILGSTSIGCFDDLMQVGYIANAHDMWLHVDCAYAGAMFSCPESQYLKRGLEHAWSVTVNCNKWMLTNFDCSMMWVRYKHLLSGPLSGFEPPPAHGLPVYRHLGLVNTRRFRAIKLWFVLRTYGKKKIRNYIRNHIALAKRFEREILRDPRFEVIGEVRTGLCCFAYRGNTKLANLMTMRLLEALNASRKIHMVAGVYNDRKVIRYAVCYEFSTPKHIDEDWALIQEYADILDQLYSEESQQMCKEVGIQKSGFDMEVLSVNDLANRSQIVKDLRDYRKNKNDGNLDMIAVKSIRLEDIFASHHAVSYSSEDVTDGDATTTSFIKDGLEAASFLKLEEEIKGRITKAEASQHALSNPREV